MMLNVDSIFKSFHSRAQENGEGARVRALESVSFEVKEGELFTLLGPSGCGKTTTLRCIAGLETPDSGTISLEDNPLFDADRGIRVPPNHRGLGMVFQSYAIWPHMTVFENVVFPLTVGPRARRVGREAAKERVHRALRVIGLDHMSERQATQLSGGQQQRLALARALVVEPRLMLLDEPLSNLDAKLREAMRFELKRLQRELGLTSIYVTHDQSEALAMSSRIAVMRDGHIIQVGSPREIYERPVSRFVAEFVGLSNILQGRVVATESGGMCQVSTPDLAVWGVGSEPVMEGASAVVSIRPESVMLAEEESAAPGESTNLTKGTVVGRAFLGEAVDHTVRIGDLELRNRSNAGQSIAPGTDVVVWVDAKRVVVMADDVDTQHPGATEDPGAPDVAVSEAGVAGHVE